MKIVKHSNGMHSYNLKKLNDQQKTSLFEIFDQDEIIHVAVSTVAPEAKVLMKNSKLYRVYFSITGVEEHILVTLE